MKNEQIINAAKEHEKRSEFGELAKSELSRGVNSAYGIGFLDGAEWCRSQPQIIEIFGKRIKIVEDDGSAKGCMECAFSYECTLGHLSLCRNTDEKLNRHFVEVDENGNEEGGKR